MGSVPATFGGRAGRRWCAALCAAGGLAATANPQASISRSPDEADIAVGLGRAVRLECQPDENCQAHAGDRAFASNLLNNGTGLLGVDDFTPLHDGAITEICWYGVYETVSGPDNFTIMYYLHGANGFPVEPPAHTFHIGNTAVKQDTGEPFYQSGIWVYSITHAPVPVVGGECYWIAIVNNRDPENWYWMTSVDGPWHEDPDAPPRQGNARCLIDGATGAMPDGFDFADTVAGFDFAFCLGMALSDDPACEFYTPYDTGHHTPAIFNGIPTQLAFSSGNLDDADDHARRTAQPFFAPALPAGQGDASWSIQQIGFEGFDPGGGLIEFLNVEIFNRVALDVAPTPCDMLYAGGNVPIDPAEDVDPDTDELILVLPIGALNLAPGDYWLTMYAANSTEGTPDFVPTNFAWFANPLGLDLDGDGESDLVNNFCTVNMPPPPPGGTGCWPSDPNGAPPGTTAMMAARQWPPPWPGGFGARALHPPPEWEADNPFNAAFRLRGQPSPCGNGVLDEGEDCDDGNNLSGDGCSMGCRLEPPGCPWDCEPTPDGNVGITDFLTLLAQWNSVFCPSCEIDGGGVGITDFLVMLANWGACP
jgi:cysteine-rich repeat protein